MRFRVTSSYSGSVVGVFHAYSRDHALDIMARSAGYHCYADIPKGPGSQTMQIEELKTAP